MIELITCADNDLPSYVRWQVLSFLRMEWPFIFRGEARLTKHIHDPEFFPFHVALVEEEVLISYATILQMQLDHASATYRVAGLANVMTYPPYRNEGHATRVVREASDHIKAGGCAGRGGGGPTHSVGGPPPADVAALFCDPALREFYARSGWEPIDGGLTLVGPAADPRPFDALRMMLFLSEKGQAGRRAFEQQPWHIAHHW
jgi:GNAT superfamily N-acetyltransferase